MLKTHNLDKNKQTKRKNNLSKLHKTFFFCNFEFRGLTILFNRRKVSNTFQLYLPKMCQTYMLGWWMLRNAHLMTGVAQKMGLSDKVLWNKLL